MSANCSGRGGEDAGGEVATRLLYGTLSGEGGVAAWAYALTSHLVGVMVFQK